MQGLIDMHCHIVPGVDDGARDLYDAAKILQLEYRNQVQAVIVTPHYRAGMFETPQREIERQFQRIDEMTRRSRSGMRVYLGCEYHTNAHMVEDLKKGLRPTMLEQSMFWWNFPDVIIIRLFGIRFTLFLLPDTDRS